MIFHIIEWNTAKIEYYLQNHGWMNKRNQTQEYILYEVKIVATFGGILNFLGGSMKEASGVLKTSYILISVVIT